MLNNNSFNINLSHADQSVLLFALSLVPEYNFDSSYCRDDIEWLVTNSSATSRKLINHEPLSLDDASVLDSAVQCALKALNRELSIDEPLRQELVNYLFSLNKLAIAFSNIFE